MYKATIFDFDGTLANDLSFFIKAYDFALSKFGIHLAADEISKACFHKSEEQIAAKFGLPSSEEFRKYYFQGADERINNVPLFPGVVELLEDLKNNKVKLGVVTLAFRWYISKMLAQTGLSKYFQSVVSCDDVTHPKPDPESILVCCKDLEVSQEETLMVGDARGDIIMGKEGKCKTALFLPDANKSFYDFEQLRATNPDYVFSTFSELRDIIL